MMIKPKSPWRRRLEEATQFAVAALLGRLFDIADAILPEAEPVDPNCHIDVAAFLDVKLKSRFEGIQGVGVSETFEAYGKTICVRPVFDTVDGVVAISIEAKQDTGGRNFVRLLISGPAQMRNGRLYCGDHIQSTWSRGEQALDAIFTTLNL